MLLYSACKEGWTSGIHFMLSEIKETSLVDQLTNETPLHAACGGNHHEIVVGLVARFPELLLVRDRLSHRRWHPIHTACAFGASIEVLEVLLVGILCLTAKEYEHMPRPANILNMCFFDALGRTPLYIATKCGNVSHINLMINHSPFDSLMQAAPTLYTVPSDANPWPSPIHCAITYNKEELLPILLEKLPLKVFANLSIFSIRHMLQQMHEGTNGKPLIYPLLDTTICQSGGGTLHLTDINAALENYKALSNLQLPPLAMAAAMGNAKFAEMLINFGATDDDGIALRLALHLKYHDIARSMLSLDDLQICLGNDKKLSTFVLPNSILSAFTEVHLEDNSLKSLPLALLQLPNLTFLNVSNNNLVELPVSNNLFQSGWSCMNLKKLYISNNKLEVLPAVIWSIPELTELLVNNNSISEIQPAIRIYAKFKKLDISHNQLCNAPQQIFAAEEVKISYNKLKDLPNCIWKSKLLTKLDAANNQIEEIHFPVSPCNSRYRPSFTSSGTRSFESESNSESSATRLNVYGNVLLSLSLSSNNLTSFPKYLNCFAHDLHRLNISNNQLTTLCINLLPPYIRYLYANGCSLETIKVKCDDCDDGCPHKGHTSLKNLVYLNLKENKLRHFNFKSDTNTTSSSLIYPTLETLDLSKNELCDQLDSSIGQQKHLNSLFLSDNPNLKLLPLELSYLSNTLKTLQLDNLPHLSDPQLKEYQFHRTPTKLLRVLSNMKSTLKRYIYIPYIANRSRWKSFAVLWIDWYHETFPGK